MKNSKADWEVNEIDLNLRHYSGKPSDVIKKIKTSIEIFLSNPEVPEKTREVYSAIYNALDYYKNISYIPSPDFSTDDTFLSYSIDNFNREFNYLSKKYNSEDPTVPPVIKLSCRIKSPLGFVEKVKSKISEYLKDDRDLRYFNESLRDLLGVRIIVDPPQEIKSQGLKAESDFLYKVFYDLMCYHGLNRQKSTNTEPEDYVFIPVNTRHSPNKLEEIKSRTSASGFIDAIAEPTEFIYIPESRIPEIEQEHVDAILKDYNMWPKHSGYQSLHTCVIPHYSNYIERLPLPPYIIPPASDDYTIEYQIRTQRQDDFAEHGAASHKLSYKPQETLYHRLAVPFYIDFDNPEDLEESITRHPIKKSLKLRNFAESYRRFYGHTFKDRFNISFTEFRDRFSSKDRDDILADKKRVHYDATRDLYYLEDVSKEVTLTNSDQELLKSILRTKTTDETLINMLDYLAITDSIISTTNSTEVLEPVSSPQTPSSLKINLYIFSTDNRSITPKKMRSNKSNFNSTTLYKSQDDTTDLNKKSPNEKKSILDPKEFE